MTGKRPIDFKLYLITDGKLVTHYSLLITAVEGALKAGVRAVQLREKDVSTRELLDMAYRMRELTARYSAKLIINDRADIALCANADGVHLGQASMPAFAVRKVIGSGLIIGVSTHNLEEASIAEKEGADFITFGPVFHTPSKAGYGAPVGMDVFKHIRDKVSIPVFAVGGIKRDNAGAVMGAGAYGIALISGILGETDSEHAARQYLKIVNKTNKHIQGD